MMQNVECITLGGELSVALDSVLVGTWEAGWLRKKSFTSLHMCCVSQCTV